MPDPPTNDTSPDKPIRFSVEEKTVRLDDEPEIEPATYLELNATPEGLRWFARVLNDIADSKDDKSKTASSAVIRPADSSQLSLSDWDALEIVLKEPEQDSRARTYGNRKDGP